MIQIPKNSLQQEIMLVSSLSTGALVNMVRSMCLQSSRRLKETALNFPHCYQVNDHITHILYFIFFYLQWGINPLLVGIQKDNSPPQVIILAIYYEISKNLCEADQTCIISSSFLINYFFILEKVITWIATRNQYNGIHLYGMKKNTSQLIR